MRKRSKTKGRMRAMRGPNGRFCKALPLAPAERQVKEAGVKRVKAMAKGEGRTTPLIYHFTSVVDHNRCYYHRELEYPVIVKLYDYFTYLDIFK